MEVRFKPCDAGVRLEQIFSAYGFWKRGIRFLDIKASFEGPNVPSSPVNGVQCPGRPSDCEKFLVSRFAGGCRWIVQHRFAAPMVRVRRRQ